MSDFRPGDRQVEIAGVSTRLRFTVSAFAEIASVLAAKSPKDLAARLRKANPAAWNAILQAMATPRPKGPLSKVELLEFAPLLSRVIAEGLAV